LIVATVEVFTTEDTVDTEGFYLETSGVEVFTTEDTEDTEGFYLEISGLYLRVLCVLRGKKNMWSAEAD